MGLVCSEGHTVQIIYLYLFVMEENWWSIFLINQFSTFPINKLSIDSLRNLALSTTTSHTTLVEVSASMASSNAIIWGDLVLQVQGKINPQKLT